MAAKYISIYPVLALVLFTLNAPAAYRYQDGFCSDGSKRGFNEGSFSECGRVEAKAVTASSLSHRVLRAMRLKYVTMRAPSWRSVDLERAVASESNWISPRLENVNFWFVDFRGARFELATVLNSQGKNADLRAIRVLYSTLTGVDLHGANLRESFFLQSQLSDVDFSGADMRGSVWLDVRCENCRYDRLTKLPWSEAEAIRRGFKLHE